MDRESNGLHFATKADARISVPPPDSELVEPVAEPLAENALAEATAVLLAELADGLAALRDRTTALEAENGKLRVALAETKATLAITAHSVERMTIDKTGPRGERGPAGADGRDGIQGPAGPKGNRGQKGVSDHRLAHQYRQLHRNTAIL
jgi:hypothetical protein